LSLPSAFAPGPCEAGGVCPPHPRRGAASAADGHSAAQNFGPIAGHPNGQQIIYVTRSGVREELWLHDGYLTPPAAKAGGER
jgi:hypothetical protein